MGNVGERRVGVRCIAWLDLFGETPRLRARVPRTKIIWKDNGIEGDCPTRDLTIPTGLFALGEAATRGESQASHVIWKVEREPAVRASRNARQNGVRLPRYPEKQVRSPVASRLHKDLGGGLARLVLDAALKSSSLRADAQHHCNAKQETRHKHLTRIR